MTDATPSAAAAHERRLPSADELRRGAGRALLARALSDGGVDDAAPADLRASLAAADDLATAGGVAAAPASAPTAGHAHGEDGAPRVAMVERLRKRGRVESVNYDHKHNVSRARGATGAGFRGFRAVANHGRLYPLERAIRKYGLAERASSSPDLGAEADDANIMNIFPDIRPRDLRIAEVKSWECDWMNRDFPVLDEEEEPLPARNPAGAGLPRAKSWRVQATWPKPLLVETASNDVLHAATSSADTQSEVEVAVDTTIGATMQELAISGKQTHPSIASPPTSGDAFTPRTDPMTPRGAPLMSPLPAPMLKTASSSRRPQLRLKLEDMPTPQQAEERAQRAANRLIAKREAIQVAAAAAFANGSSNVGDGPSAAQAAHMRLNFQSYNSSGGESDLQSPTDAGRHSAGSAYSPNHGMFTTKNVAVSEAGISSPDAACLHLQENLERVKEIGRGASGVVYKAIHIPTLKVVAVKDVPVYGRGQRRQMVRELHALYSNLVPMSDGESPHPADTTRKNKPRPAPSPYIVYFYDAFVDRPKNSMCLVMEYMSTGSLQDIVTRGGCQNEKIIARLAIGVLRGLAHIHRKRMVHRDIKPHNLLTNRQGEVKISDFGLARTLNDSGGTTKTFVGTLLYMAPERIGGGDYSYPADIWSCGLALLSVALGRYPLPTQDGFFGLVDSVANEEALKLPADQFSVPCRAFIELCLAIDPDDRPSAEELLRHEFVNTYSPDETLHEWLRFIEEKELCDDREADLEAFADAAYRHLYERCAKFSYQPQSDFGVSFMSQATPTYSRRMISIDPIQMSLQLGLANSMGLPVHAVYEKFEEKRAFYSDKLLEEYCYSPQSWTASPGINRRQQLFGTESESPVRRDGNERSSFWRKLHDSMARLSTRRKKRDKTNESEETPPIFTVIQRSGVFSSHSPK